MRPVILEVPIDLVARFCAACTAPGGVRSMRVADCVLLDRLLQDGAE